MKAALYVKIINPTIIFLTRPNLYINMPRFPDVRQPMLLSFKEL
jgi:hypothetical protein